MKKILIVLLLLSFTTIYGQEKATLKLEGNLSADSKMLYEKAIQNPSIIPVTPIKKKSGFIAGLLSAVIPGVGQFYTEHYIKAAAFLSIEAILIYFAIDYNKEGDDRTEDFHKYALQHWSPAQYAKNSILNFGLDAKNYEGLFTSDNMSEIDYSRWDLIHKMEADIASKADGKYYSHQLASFKDQQYYEMIGKYTQFNAGWDDFIYNENDKFGFNTSVTKRFSRYAGMRGDANSSYDKSSTFVTVIMINHLLSVVDAVLSTKWYNEKIKIKAEMGKENLGFYQLYYPKLRIKYNL